MDILENNLVFFINFKTFQNWTASEFSRLQHKKIKCLEQNLDQKFLDQTLNSIEISLSHLFLMGDIKNKEKAFEKIKMKSAH